MVKLQQISQIHFLGQKIYTAEQASSYKDKPLKYVQFWHGLPYEITLYCRTLTVFDVRPFLSHHDLIF